MDVPTKYVDAEGVALGTWLANIRAWRNAGAQQKYLTHARIQQLNDLGMVWDVYDYYWERNYTAASEYYRENGNLDVPQDYVNKEGIRLGYWINRLRSLRAGIAKGTPPTPEQVKRLDEIGMIWDRQKRNKWEKAFRAAKEYVDIHGDLCVPIKYVTGDGFALGTWIQRQRQNYKKGKLPEENKKRLDKIGMVWQADTWENRFSLVKQWYQEKGSLKIPQNTVVDGVWIGKWIVMQKKYLEAGKLSQEQEESFLYNTNIGNSEKGG
ncbi:MAG: helicase associated domain-containing protein [Clostridiales bacterium]|nr:helicase associated domain-containing protein [Clostridiales bacterium]